MEGTARFDTPRRLSSRVAWLVALAACVSLPLEAQWSEAMEAFKKKNWSAAEEGFQAYVNRQPEAAAGHYMLGMTQLALRNEAAIGSLLRAVELEPDQPSYRVGLARGQVASNPEAAIATLAAVDLSTLGEQRPAYVALLQKGFSSVEDPTPQLPVLEQAATKLSEPRLWLALSQKQKDLGRFSDAQRSCARAWELEATREAAEMCAFAAAKNAARLEGPEAEAAYRTTAEFAERAIEKGSESRRRLAADARLLSGEPKAARAHFEKLSENERQEASVLYSLGLCSIEIGDDERAQHELEKALERSPDESLEPKIHNSLAKLYQGRDELSLAAKHYRLAGEVARADQIDAVVAQRRVEAAKREACEQRRDEAQVKLDKLEPIRGTSDWDRIVGQMRRKLADCADYIDLDALFGTEE